MTATLLVAPTAPSPPAPSAAPTVDAPTRLGAARARWTTIALVALMLAAGVVYSMGIHLGLVHNYYGPAVYACSAGATADRWLRHPRCSRRPAAVEYWRRPAPVRWAGHGWLQLAGQ